MIEILRGVIAMCLTPEFQEDAIPFCLSGHWPCDLFKLCFLCLLSGTVLKELYLVPTDLFLTPVASV